MQWVNDQKITWRRNLLIMNGSDISPIRVKSFTNYWIYRPWGVALPDLVKIDRVTQWLPVLNDTTNNFVITAVSHCLDKILNNFLSTVDCLEISSHRYLWVKICRRLLSCSMKSLLLHVPTCKMNKLNLLGTCKTYIECIEEANSGGLSTWSSVWEIHLVRQGWTGHTDQIMSW